MIIVPADSQLDVQKPEDLAVFVAVDIGQVLWAEVTPEAAAELELTPGSQVICLLKAHSLRVVD